MVTRSGAVRPHVLRQWLSRPDLGYRQKQSAVIVDLVMERPLTGLAKAQASWLAAAGKDCGPSGGSRRVAIIASAATAGTCAAVIRSAQLNQYHQLSALLSGAAIMSAHTARLCGSCTNRDANRRAGG